MLIQNRSKKLRSDLIFDGLINARNKVIFFLLMIVGFSANAQANEQQKGDYPAPILQDSSNDKIIDVGHYLPSIEMEQFGLTQTRSQGYRIRIFDDGRVIYDGLKSVKNFGEIISRVSPEQVAKIKSKFAELKFWKIPENQYGIPKGIATLDREFTLRRGLIEKKIRFSGRGLSYMFKKIIEEEVNSAQWRCPALDDRGIELCARDEKFEALTISSFMKNDLPVLNESYK